MVLTEMMLWASSRSMPVVSASICAIRGMQAVLPSRAGKSSTVRNGAAVTSLAAEEAGGSGAVEADEAGPLLPEQAVRTPAAEQAARPSRKLRREIFVFFIRKNLLSWFSNRVRHRH